MWKEWNDPKTTDGEWQVKEEEGGGERYSPPSWVEIYRLGGEVRELDCVCYWCSCSRASFSDVLIPTPLPLPLHGGISIYELMKKEGQHGFGEKNIK